MTTDGVALEVGVTPELRYKFKIPETATAGRAWFAVTVNFPAEGQTVNSPRVYFKILGENPHG